jgi:parvulin-like peptidyl-prolyl isomerase
MFHRWTLFAALGLVLGLPLQAETLATVGSEKISRADLDAAAAAEAQALKRELSKDERLALLRSMVNQRLLVAEARRRKLDREPAFRAAVDEFQRRALAERIFNEEVASKAAVSLEQAREFYERNPGLFDVAEVSQIVVAPGEDPMAAEKKARALAERLKKSPRGFAAAAKKDSDDALSRERGGDVGTLRRGMLLPELEGAVFAAKSGEVVGPVRTQFGWHLLHVRSLKRLGWEQAGADLQGELQRLQAQQLQQALLEEVGKRVKPRIAEDKL